MLKRLAGYAVSLAIIMGCLYAGIAIQSALAISVPGSIIGMLILFALLASGLAPVEWVKPTASLFIRYMILLFVPISVGLMNHYQLLLDNALPILASAIGGSAIVLVILAKGLDKLLEGDN